MTAKLSRRGFLLGTTALVASSSAVTRMLATPAPAGSIAAAPMTAAEVLRLQHQFDKDMQAIVDRFFARHAAIIQKAHMDILFMGQCALRIDRDPDTGAIDVEHVEASELVKIRLDR